MLNGKLWFTHCGWLKMNCEMVNHGLLNTFLLAAFIHYTKPISNQLPYDLPWYVSPIIAQQKYQLSRGRQLSKSFPKMFKKKNIKKTF